MASYLRFLTSVLYDVPEVDEKALDVWDGVTLGYYRKVKVRVDTLEGDVLAWLYVLNAWEGGLPSERHVTLLADAAVRAGAPEDYVGWLRSRPCNPSLRYPPARHTVETVAVEGQAHVGKTGDKDKPQVFRSPVAVAVWWVWALFAVGNLIDLAVQGRNHTSVVAAAILVFVTGVVYVTAQLPRVVARPDDVLIRNPLRDHVIGWGSVVKIDTLDLLRVHCEWEADGATKTKTFHAWAVQHSRRREAMQKTRQDRRMRRGLAPTRPDSIRGSYGSPTPENPLGSPQHAVDSLQAAQAAARERNLPATRPVSVWRWQAFLALVAPAILLAIVAAL